MLASALVYGACGNDTSDDTTTGTTTSTGASGSSGTRTTGTSTAPGASTSTETDNSAVTGNTTSAVQLNDAQIATISMTANRGEVEQNMVALSRIQREDARTYAQQMVDEHTIALEREMAMATSMNLSPTESPTSRMLQTTSDQMVAMLQSASAGDFDAVYIQSQVDAHQMVLSLIESTLLPSADAQPLKDELTTMQTAVRMHLEHARELKGED